MDFKKHMQLGKLCLYESFFYRDILTTLSTFLGSMSFLSFIHSFYYFIVAAYQGKVFINRQLFFYLFSLLLTAQCE
jgi:hypothetical protein